MKLKAVNVNESGKLQKIARESDFLGQKNFFFCPYVMASRMRTRTRCRQQLLQTSSSQKLLHLQTLFFAHMLLGLVPTNFVHNSFITCTQGTQRAKMCQKKHFL